MCEFQIHNSKFQVSVRRHKPSRAEQEFVGIARRDQEIVGLVVQGWGPSGNRAGVSDEQHRHVRTLRVPIEGGVDGDHERAEREYEERPDEPTADPGTGSEPPPAAE